ncbi:MAG TPA: glycosyltransferase family 39 protein [Vicinamibacterales bacterium]|nr:glycosyltransferase family 39 protein [Vicinamibacterales bacterium]
MAVWLGPLLIAASFASLTVWSWRKWPDLLVDFGQQLYIPWRLAAGERLYRDIDFLHGPLSQHFNALWFRLFGPSFTILIVLNLAVLAAITAMSYGLVGRMADRLTATTACLILLGIFGFSQYLGTGNYNFVAPYTHESTHGLALAIAMTLLLARALTAGGRAPLVAAGLCLGLALLTKVDVAVGAVAVAVAGVLIAIVARPAESRPAITNLALAAATAVAPILLFFLYLRSYLPTDAALTAVRSGFSVLSSDVARNPFYVAVLGFDDVPGNTGRMFAAFGWIALAGLAAAAADAALRRLTSRPVVPSLIVGAALFAYLVVTPDAVPWRDLARALPLTTGVILAGTALRLWRTRGNAAAARALVPAALWATLALALLAKIVLNARLDHYGFYLAMPATVLLATALVDWVPRALGSTAGSGTLFRALALAVLAGGVMAHLAWSNEIYRFKTLPVGSGGDLMYAYRRDLPAPNAIAAEALAWIENETPPTATIAALPEGITFNYLSRRPTTLPEINFMMTEAIVFGEAPILEAFHARPPDYVMLVDKDTSEFGVGAFGSDPSFGRRIMDWVAQHYDVVFGLGEEPFRHRGFGIKILKVKRQKAEVKGQSH